MTDTTQPPAAKARLSIAVVRAQGRGKERIDINVNDLAALISAHSDLDRAASRLCDGATDDCTNDRTVFVDPDDFDALNVILDKHQQDTQPPAKALMPRVTEPDEDEVHFGAPFQMGHVTLCGLTDFIHAKEKGRPTRKKVTCKGCLSIVDFVLSHRIS